MCFEHLPLSYPRSYKKKKKKELGDEFVFVLTAGGKQLIFLLTEKFSPAVSQRHK